MEKGGLAAALAAVGLTAASGVGFADELRLGLRGTTRRVWGRRGTKVRQRLQLRYEWRYLFAAVDARAGRIWWDWVDTMKAADLAPVLAGLREMDVLDALVWDGAPSHGDADVRAVGLPLIALPPYSPELNPAERLFEEVRRRVGEKSTLPSTPRPPRSSRSWRSSMPTRPASAGSAAGAGSPPPMTRSRHPWKRRHDHAGPA